MARARQLGLNVVKPYGDSASCAVGIESGGQLLRVQIKSRRACEEGLSFAVSWDQLKRHIRPECWISTRFTWVPLFVVHPDICGDAEMRAPLSCLPPAKEGQKYEGIWRLGSCCGS